MAGISIKSNVASLNAQRKLAESSAALATVYERLSSGQRINKASDDAAGLAIAEALKKDTRVYTQAVRNVNDGVSALNIAQGALEQLTSVSIRQRELAAQAANGTYSLTQRRAMNTEANSLADEFNRIVGSTKFNGMQLLDNSSGELRVQCGYGIDGSIGFNMGDDLSRTAGTGSFNLSATYQVPSASASSPYALALGDVNGDGIADMLVTGVGYDGMYYTGLTGVYTGNGDGTFSLCGTYASPGLAQYTDLFSEKGAIAIGDVNGDGKQDMVVSGNSQVYGGATAVFLGNGDGTFALSQSLATHPGANSLTNSVSLADINGDGKDDMVVAGNVRIGGVAYSSTSVYLANSNGDGTFTLAASYRIQGDAAHSGDSQDVSLADINGDGKQDMVVSGAVWSGGRWVGQTSALLGNGDGTFSLAGSYASPGYGVGLTIGTSSVSMADLNGDGVEDMAIAGVDNTGAATFGSTYVYLGNGDGSFRLSGTYASQGNGSHNGNSTSVSLGDLNGDGIYDMAVSGMAGGYGRASIFLGNGDGTFKLDSSFDAYANHGIALGDLNGDGACDMAAAFGNRDHGDLGVYLANTRQVTTTPHLNLCTREGALDAMGTIDKTLQRISSELGAMGSCQSRFSVTLNTLTVSAENFSAAAGRIMDADVAEESATLVRTQILQQAGAAVLAQANQQPSLALRLLAGS